MSVEMYTVNNIHFKVEVIEPVEGKRVLRVPKGTTLYDLYKMTGVIPSSHCRLLNDVVIELELHRKG